MSRRRYTGERLDPPSLIESQGFGDSSITRIGVAMDIGPALGCRQSGKEEAPETGAARGFFGFRWGGTCDGEGKNPSRRGFSLLVSF
jgi:hypothetical protein